MRERRREVGVREKLESVKRRMGRWCSLQALTASKILEPVPWNRAKRRGSASIGWQSHCTRMAYGICSTEQHVTSLLVGCYAQVHHEACTSTSGLVRRSRRSSPGAGRRSQVGGSGPKGPVGLAGGWGR